jgi:hypothetical protein
VVELLTEGVERRRERGAGARTEIADAIELGRWLRFSSARRGKQA